MSSGYCKTCDRKFDLVNDCAFIDWEEMPVVLDIQLRGTPTMRKAINFVKKNHHISDIDYEDDDGKLVMYHYDKDRTGNFSHNEPDDEGHILEMAETGYWSFQ